MPLSTSNFNADQFIRPGLRLTASDRPGVAQPVPERDIPDQPWLTILLGAIVLLLLLVGLWENHWRDFGAETGYYLNNAALWAQERRRIDRGEGDKLVIVGDSRMLFDIQLPVWEKLTGERPIQLSLEGTSSIPVMEDLAEDPNFTGRLLVGMAPGVFFTGSAYRANAIGYFHKESPAQRAGHWLSQRLIEPRLAFLDSNFSLGTLTERMDWPVRSGMQELRYVSKLSVQERDRNSHMWSKLVLDREYRDAARATWLKFGGPPPTDLGTPAGDARIKAEREGLDKTIAQQIQKAKAVVAKLNAHGVEVVFVRPPSSGTLYEDETMGFPRAQTWDKLLEQTNTKGIHFEDHPGLQGYDLPEWSHLSATEAERFTAALVPIYQRLITPP